MQVVDFGQRRKSVVCPLHFQPELNATESQRIDQVSVVVSDQNEWLAGSHLIGVPNRRGRQETKERVFWLTSGNGIFRHNSHKSSGISSGLVKYDTGPMLST